MKERFSHYVEKTTMKTIVNKQLMKIIMMNWLPSCIWKWKTNQQLIMRGK